MRTLKSRNVKTTESSFDPAAIIHEKIPWRRSFANLGRQSLHQDLVLVNGLIILEFTLFQFEEMIAQQCKDVWRAERGLVLLSCHMSTITTGSTITTTDRVSAKSARDETLTLSCNTAGWQRLAPWILSRPPTERGEVTCFNSSLFWAVLLFCWQNTAILCLQSAWEGFFSWFFNN